MKKSLLSFAAAATIFTACNKSFETTESGVRYRVITHEDGSKEIQPGEMVFVNLRLATESNDSVIMETFSTNSPRYIPADEPNLKEVFAVITKGDSVEIIVNADSLFQNSFGVEKPEALKDEKNIRFLVKIVDVFNQQELEQQSIEQTLKLREKDSLALREYVGSLQNVKSTASGLMYVVEKEGTGKKPKNGDKVSMKYKGYFTTGEVFDSNIEQGEPFVFTLGLGHVIPGWDEGVALLKEGGKYKFIIPWNLAYGERGTGPIPPFTSLIFDVELVKVN